MQKQETIQLTGFELFVIIFIMCTTIGFLVSPSPIYQHVHSAAWYVPLLALLPGLFYSLIYQSLLAHSPYPLPYMFEHYWGKAIGWLLGLFYAWFFLIWTAFWVRLFLDFQLSIINPMQPISVLITGILVVNLYALKKGVATTIRALETIFFILLLLFAILVIFLGVFQADFSRLLPLYYGEPLTLTKAVLYYSRFYAMAGIGLILGHFVSQPTNPGAITRRAIFLTGLMLAMTIMVTIGVIGNLNLNDAYPIFDMVRRLRIGTFIRNLDAFFIVIWFTGIFFSIFTLWFAFIFILHKTFRLSDYRPLAAATIIMVGITAISLGANAVEVKDLQNRIMYPLLMVFLVVIPFCTWIIGLMRGKIKLKSTPSPTKTKG